MSRVFAISSALMRFKTARQPFVLHTDRLVSVARFRAVSKELQLSLILTSDNSSFLSNRRHAIPKAHLEET